MNLFIVGSNKVYAIENFYVKYLRQQGVNVFHFPAQSYFYDYYQSSVINKILFKAGLSGILQHINRKFREEVNAFNPEIIWVFKGMEIFPEDLKWAKDKNIKLVNFNGDSPFLFSGKGSGNANVTNAISLYDLHLTYNGEVKKEMERRYNIPTAILPFGFNLPDEAYEKCVREREIIKACFLGNPDIYRGRFLQELAKSGTELDVYGNDWQKFVSHPNITVYKPVYGDDFWLTLRKYRVQLNLMRPHNPDTHNMRSFEVPGVGGIQLAPVTQDHKTFFEPESEIFLYNDLSACNAQLTKILGFSYTKSADVRQAARQRSIHSGYTYEARSRQALKLFEEYFTQVC